MIKLYDSEIKASNSGARQEKLGSYFDWSTLEVYHDAS